MRWSRNQGGAVAVALAALAVGVMRADDDAPVAAVAPAPAPPAPQPSIDLAAHVDTNIMLQPDHWRVSGDLRTVLGGGRLVIGGNLMIGGPLPEAAGERISRTDAAIRERLGQLRAERLAAVAADERMTAAGRRSLELATAVDMRRVTAEVARLRSRYAGRRANLGDEAWREFQRDVESCRRSLADPFGADSLFAAVRAGLEPEP